MDVVGEDAARFVEVVIDLLLGPGNIARAEYVVRREELHLIMDRDLDVGVNRAERREAGRRDVITVAADGRVKRVDARGELIDTDHYARVGTDREPLGHELEPKTDLRTVQVVEGSREDRAGYAWVRRSDAEIFLNAHVAESDHRPEEQAVFLRHDRIEVDVEFAAEDQ